MAYVVKYQGEFDSYGGNEYRVEFLFSGYSGSVTEFILGGNPVVVEWPDDDVRKTIRGASCTVQIVNNDGSFPLENLYSDSDKEIRCDVYFNDALIFSGFVVQDDSRDVLLDAAHYLTIKATDGLGLLKDINLSDAAKYNSPSDEVSVTASSNGSILTVPISTGLQFGDTVRIIGTPSSDGYYTVDLVTAGANLELVTTPFVPAFTSQTVTLEIIDPVELVGKVQLSQIIMLCLRATGLRINTDVWFSLVAFGSTNERALEQTYINAEDFLNNSSWQSCFDVLNNILFALNAQVFQAHGVWNIIRWDEMRLNDNAISRRTYDDEFIYQGISFLEELPFLSLTQGDSEAGAQYGYVRPLRYAGRKFNYEQPDNILKNGNLQRLGVLVNQYSNVFGEIYEYEFPDWDSVTSGYDYWIRVVRDSAGTELERYVIVQGPGDAVVCRSQPIEVNAGDKIKISYSFRTDSAIIPATVAILIQLTDSPTLATFKGLKGTSDWADPPNAGLDYQVLITQNSTEWTSVTVESDPIPLSGVLYWNLLHFNTYANEFHYQDLSFQYIPAVNQSTKIKGHEHKTEQVLLTTNVSDDTLAIDDTTRNSLRGTLFLGTSTGVLRDRTAQWDYTYAAPSNLRKLGEITTFEELYWRRIARVAMEMTILKTIHDFPVSPLTIIFHTLFPNKTFLIGRISVDLKRGTAQVNLSELWDSGLDTDDDILNAQYTFRCIYDKI